MTYELREGQGSLFGNADREQGSNRPEWTGNLRVAGQTWRLAAWCRETRAGARYLSIKATPLEREPRGTGAAKSGRPASAQPRGESARKNALSATTSAPERDEFDDDIPF